MADDDKKRLEEAKKAKQAEIDRKRAEVRKRMEEASKAKKAKKGFMTPERKKKLRLLLRKKAAEELKKEQERKAAERRRIIEERCGKPKNIEDANEDELRSICTAHYDRINRLENEKYDLEYVVKRKDHEVVRRANWGTMLKRIIQEYYDRMYVCEGQKWDLEHEVRKRDFEISDLNNQVNDLRGKFVKPTLKKVSKYENKFAKLQKKAAEFNFRNQLKVVKKKEFTLEEEDKEKKPDWSKGKPGDQKEHRRLPRHLRKGPPLPPPLRKAPLRLRHLRLRLRRLKLLPRQPPLQSQRSWLRHHRLKVLKKTITPFLN
ncbi:hypothetical protein MSG28_001764 [Choristoneura fumiferana]|uniref:Uncharacterized protein n=1 Tax=Choristoneura fumiferana TaxID=7141 RepID=A0ACC0KVE7_CHOFU|nr:hypothetical protein MSG28_001764 [Choristoneura fumiferana]